MAGRPITIGLTGSIGMGKSETARLFAEAGIPVYDSDAVVHRLYDSDGAAVDIIAKNFPGAVQDGKVDRAILRDMVSGDEEALARLGHLVHPLVAAERDRFLKEAERSGAAMVVLDIPLLFEIGAHGEVDAIVVVSAPAHIQRERVLARPGMTPELFDSLVQKQLPDAEKRAKAHFVVVTDKGLDHAREQVQMIVAALKDRHGILD
jgi:dephospho-CoA kinase